MTPTDMPPRDAGDRPRNGLKLVLAWGFVGLPLVWGVVQTLANAVKAFR